MFKCENCEGIFRDSYNLRRHMSRLKPCKSPYTVNTHDTRKNEYPNSIREYPNSTREYPNSTQEYPNSTREYPNYTELHPKNTPENSKQNKIHCEFCLKKYSRVCKLKQHYNICKLKNDPIRLLELENKIDPDIPSNKLECRFCNLVFCRSDTLNKHIGVCNGREDYHKNLIKKREITIQNQTNIQNQNNNTNCNNTTINNNNNTNNLILNFGEETMDHITTIDIIRILKEAKDEYRQDEF